MKSIRDVAKADSRKHSTNLYTVTKCHECPPYRSLMDKPIFMLNKNYLKEDSLENAPYTVFKIQKITGF
jgi:hypothetical protein